MLRNSLNRAKRLFIALVLVLGLFSVNAIQRTAAQSDFSCTNIMVDGVFTGNIFFTSSTSSAGFYYFYYNVYTGAYTMGPAQ
jgi:hypothetical protein